jgi:hypothetical protein
MLFDIAADPFEKRDIAQERPERTAYWRSVLIRELNGRPEGYVENGKLVAGRAAMSGLPWVGIGKSAYE